MADDGQDDMVVATEAYFGLRLEGAIIASVDPVILRAMAIPNNSNFTVEAWVQPDERTDLDEDDECVIIRNFGFWEIGLLGDGRAFGRWFYTEPGSNEILSATLASDSSTDTGNWIYLSLTVSLAGQLSLYISETLVAQSPVQDGKRLEPAVTDPRLELGGINFSGRLRSVFLSNRCKTSYSDPVDPSKSVYDFADSMYHAQMHMLPTDCIAAVNLLHPTGDPEDPDSAVPLCVLHLPLDSNLSPIMTEIPIPDQNGIQLQTLTAARAFSWDAHVECGFGAIRHQKITLEAWVKFNSSQVSTTASQFYTIASCGSSTDPSKTYNPDGLSVGWQFGIRTVPTDSGVPIVTLELSRYKATGLATLNSSDVLAGKWMHLAITQGSSIYVTVNGKSVDFTYDQSNGFVKDEIEHFPVLIGGFPISFDITQYEAGKLIETKDNWAGWIKLLRIWKQPLSLAEISKLVDLDFEVSDMAELFIYADLDSPSPADISMNVEVKCSVQTSYDDSVASNVNLALKEPGGDPGLSKRIIQHIGQENRRIGTISRGLTSRLQADPDTLFLAGFLDEGNPWCELIDCTANIIFLVIEVLSKASVNKERFAKVLLKIFGKFAFQLVPYIKAIIDAKGLIQPIMTACLDIMYLFHSSGILKDIVECFALNWFGILRLIGRFVPYVGTAALIADVIYVAVELGVVIYRFVTRTAKKEETPLGLIISPKPLTDRLSIAQGETFQFVATLDHQPSGTQSKKVSLSCLPINTFSIVPSSFTLDKSNWQTGVVIKIACLDTGPIGQALVQSSDGVKLIQFTTRKKATLEIAPLKFVALLERTGNEYRYTIQFKITCETPQGNDPTITYLALDEHGNVIPDVSVTTKSSSVTSVDYGPRTTRSTKRRLEEVAKLVSLKAQKISQLKATAVGTGYNTQASSSANPRNIEEQIDIYMINAGSGDAFYLHFLRRVPKDDKDWDIFQSTMIIDGGHGERRARLMFKQVAEEHLPQKIPPNNLRGPIDLVIATHQDNDHIQGLVWLYEQMNFKRGFGRQGTETITPGLTWANRPYGADANSRTTLQDPTEVGSSERLVISKNVNTVASSPVVSSPGGNPSNKTDTKTQLPNNLGATKEATQLEEYIEGNNWPVCYAPLVMPDRFGPETISKSGALVSYVGPALTAVEVVASTTTSETVNAASIISEIASISSDPPWTSLWTGDAWDDGTAVLIASANIRSAIGLLPGEKKHYVLMKVPHHGSSDSSKAAFFADVTADHYLISYDGSHGLPTMECIQWILDGHFLMRAREKNRATPTIWVSNPLDPEFAFDYQGGTIYHRNQTNGSNPELIRKSFTGSLYFQFVNGTLVGEPTVLMGPNWASGGEIYVLPFTNTRKQARRVTIPNPISQKWTPLFPNDQSKALPEEIHDLQTNVPNGLFYRVVCSQSWGTWEGVFPQTTTYKSDYSLITASPYDPIPLKWIKMDYSIYLQGFASLGCGTSGTPPTVPDGSDPSNPWVTVKSFVLQDGEYVNGVDVYKQVGERGGEWPSGLVFWTNEGRKLPFGEWDTEMFRPPKIPIPELQAEFRPPDDTYGMVGWRFTVYESQVLVSKYSSATAVPRLGIVWMPMDEY